MNTQKMKLLERACPFCCKREVETILDLRVNDFAPLNSTYALDKIEDMGFMPDQSFPIVKCRLCGFVYAQYVLYDKLLDYVYSTLISVDKALIYRHEKVTRWQKMGILLLLFSLVPKDPTQEISLLDFGCGWGETLQIAQACGARGFGVEIEPERIQFLREKGIVIEKTIDELKPHGPFDIIYTSTVLEHVENPRKILEDLASVTKRGGIGFVGVPAYSERRMSRICVDFKQGKGLPNKNINPWEHLNYFSPMNLRAMLEQCGFKVIAPISNLSNAPFLLNLKSSIALLKSVVTELSFGLLWYRTRRNRLIVQRV